MYREKKSCWEWNQCNPCQNVSHKSTVDRILHYISCKCTLSLALLNVDIYKRMNATNAHVVL